MATLGQYPPELLSLLGGLHISDNDGKDILTCITHNKASAGSDGSVKDRRDGHAFCITDKTFTKKNLGICTYCGVNTRDVLTAV